MSITWLFSPYEKQHTKARISGQLYRATNVFLCLRNPWVNDSVFMGKLYTAMTIALAIYQLPTTITELDLYERTYEDTFILFAIPFIFTPFLAYRIFLIKRLSYIYLNRTTRKIFYLRMGKLVTFEWSCVKGGIFRRTEFGGSSFTTSYALAFAPFRADGNPCKKDCLWIDSNEPTEPDIQYVAEVWEYLRHFMDHGLDNLPPPSEPNWWHRPLHVICLTPAEAWRHYAPWRTGEPGEMQGKKNWQLPFWAVLFPYNLTVALCWYLICRLFNVKAAPPPPEAFEEAPTRPKKRKRA